MPMDRRSVLAGLAAVGCSTPQKAGYDLTFADEFTDTDVSRINENATGGHKSAPAWRSRYRHPRLDAINGEKQIYMDPEFSGTGNAPLGVQPFEIRNSILRIRADRADPQKVSLAIKGASYTSGCITSEYTHTQTYGYFEMCARLPRGRGFWPAFWMLPAADHWPPEIDPLEGSGARPNQIHMGYLLGPPAGSKENRGYGEWIDVDADLFGAFNVFAVEWTKDYLSFLFNGRETFRKPNDGVHEPMYMLANLAIGSKDPNWIPDPDETTVFPGFLEIDYIRAYKRV